MLRLATALILSLASASDAAAAQTIERSWNLPAGHTADVLHGGLSYDCVGDRLVSVERIAAGWNHFVVYDATGAVLSEFPTGGYRGFVGGQPACDTARGTFWRWEHDDPNLSPRVYEYDYAGARTASFGHVPIASGLAFDPQLRDLLLLRTTGSGVTSLSHHSVNRGGGKELGRVPLATPSGAAPQHLAYDPRDHAYYVARSLSSPELLRVNAFGEFAGRWDLSAIGVQAIDGIAVDVGRGWIWLLDSAADRIVAVSGIVPAGGACGAWGPPVLNLEGDCTGVVIFQLAGCDADSFALLYHGLAGSAPIPSGACAGTVLPVAAPHALLGLSTGQRGRATARMRAPAGACGRTLVAVQLAGCRVSNAATF